LESGAEVRTKRQGAPVGAPWSWCYRQRGESRGALTEL